jgi:hypothetical protein
MSAFAVYWPIWRLSMRSDVAKPNASRTACAVGIHSMGPADDQQRPRHRRRRDDAEKTRTLNVEKSYMQLSAIGLEKPWMIATYWR